MPPHLQSGMGRVKSNLASRVKKGAMSQAAADAALARVKGALDYADFKRWLQLRGGRGGGAQGATRGRLDLDFGRRVGRYGEEAALHYL